MTAVEGGDFENGVRLMNRILAVRGQVVPVSPIPLTLHARLDGRLDRRWPVADHAHLRASSASGCRPTASNASEGRARGHHRRRADRPRPRQPVHQPPAEPAHPGHPRRRPGGVRARRSSSATSRPRTARPADSTWPTTSRRSSRTRARRSPTSSSPTTRCRRGPDADATAKAVRLRWPPSSTPPPRLILDDVLDADDPHHHDPVRLATAVIRALEQEAGIRRRTSSRTA